ncbi:uncharacterized protein CTHT_0034910 [Thermochaetoides thermophila DSM 1495]|uniref:Uncharacterized protein n=1 Tax=Chaetomium thermophilum (strain DSM 1495 / CBS 144.50 / IMI 039719) TaxID=759272 RepID=G0S6H2_CHATD|nr:hypothetical protein CTHT_0034910 [Thermochaetoides thermophila DSM 1495]EGS21627.1 hypothetical protein CTHT_0034910 [Thermochaetoides thermophila DSM 1495]
MVQLLQPILRKANLPHQKQNVERDDIGIVRMTTELVMIFRTSRACFHVFITRLKKPDMSPLSIMSKFDPQTMKPVKRCSFLDPKKRSAPVDLATSPGILKTTNSDGTDYHQERVLVKPQPLGDLHGIVEVFNAQESKTKSGDRPQRSRTRSMKQNTQNDDDVVDLI